MTLYTATGLADIAEQFDARCEERRKGALRAKTQSARDCEASSMLTWLTAADILRNTTLTPDPIIAELADAAREYMSQFGQALECHHISYGPDQVGADKALRAVLAKIEGAA